MKDYILNKFANNNKRFGDLFPHSTKNGKYNLSENCSWTGGFYTGINYLCYEMSKAPEFLEAAQKPLYRLEKSLKEIGTALGHDIGFLISPSFYADYLLTGNENSKEMVITAGDTLIKRYNPNGEYIVAWDVWDENHDFFKENSTRMIIDCLYNLPLLFKCSEFTGDPKYYDIAYKHAKTAQKYLVRDDFTTFHTFVFNEDGTPRYGKTFQGFSDDSCWARGQAWAITGFAMAYKHTKDLAFLTTSQKCLEVYLNNAESDLVPKWDLVFKGDKNEPLDTSAASIVGCGLMDLYDITSNMKFKEYAYKILDSLSAYKCEGEGLIGNATGHKPFNDSVDCSIVYGDYYFTELYARVNGMSKGYWD